jgi:hypothetical protein
MLKTTTHSFATYSNEIIGLSWVAIVTNKSMREFRHCLSDQNSH